MPLTVLDAPENFGLQFGQAISGGISKGLEKRRELQQQQAIAQRFPELAGMSPELQKAAIPQLLKGMQPDKPLNPLQQTQQKLAEERLKALQQEEQMFAGLTNGGKEPLAISDNQRPPPYKLEETENKKSPMSIRDASDEQLRLWASFKGQPGRKGVVGNAAQAEADRREKVAAEERSEKKDIRKEERKDIRAKDERLRRETEPVRKEISDRAELARRGIENKEKLIDIINTGNIDDPTYATFLESLPGNIGKRFLSPETVEYKAALVQNFSDLKTLFTGATRVKEIEILEGKIPDIYLTDQQKKQILLSSIEGHKADLLKEEAAEELEAEVESVKRKPMGLIQYRKAIDDKLKPKLNALANRVIDQQNSIIKDAENRKKIPLRADDPEDLEIIDQILKEAGGDYKAAERLAKKKGYTF